MKRYLPMVTLAAVFLPAALANASILFDFENAPIHTSLPINVTAGGITAHLSATGQGFSTQTPSSSIGVTPAGFSGLCIAPNSVFQADLLISFSSPLSDFSILYSPQELACDSSARMRVTAYTGTSLVGSTTAVASPAGTWPTGTLSISSAAGFDNVVVHYDAPPPTGGDYGVIFVADNMTITAIPEPASLTMFALGISAALVRPRRKRL